MYSENLWKSRLEKLIEINPYIHICVSLEKPHVEMKDVTVKLVGVYKHIFQIEAENKGKTERYSIQYGDISAGIIKIKELQA